MLLRNKKLGRSNKKHYYADNDNFSNVNNFCPSAFVNKIICADSRDILAKLPDNCIDVIITSPPYNFNMDYDAHKDSSAWENYFKDLFSIFKECIRVCKYGGRVIVNVQPCFSDFVPTHHIISKFFMEQKMIWRGEIVWEKNNFNCNPLLCGTMGSPKSPFLKYTWEFVEIFCKGDLQKKGAQEFSTLSNQNSREWTKARWAIATEASKKWAHPARFPENLINRLIHLFSYKHDIILDPFNGAGTTTVVAHRLDRKYLGIDISEEYCSISRRRLASD